LSSRRDRSRDLWFSNHRESLGFSSQDSNLRGRLSSRRDRSKDLWFSNMSNRDSNSKISPGCRHLKVHHRDNLRGKSSSSRRDRSRGMMFSNPNTRSLKENLKEAR
jgi:hypothetical protein